MLCPRCDGSGELRERGLSINPRSGVLVPDPQCDVSGTCSECHGTGDVDWPAHQPAAYDAPIPGRRWYSACEPADYDSERGYFGAAGHVDPSTGICTACGEKACPACGHEIWPDGICACPPFEKGADL